MSLSCALASATVKHSRSFLRRRQFDLAPLQHLLVGLQPPALREIQFILDPEACDKANLNSKRAIERSPHSGYMTSEARKSLDYSTTSSASTHFNHLSSHNGHRLSPEGRHWQQPLPGGDHNPVGCQPSRHCRPCLGSSLGDTISTFHGSQCVKKR